MNIGTMLTVAAVCFTGGVLQAQNAAEARIPFAFQVGTDVLPAGHYNFMSSAGKPATRILNKDTGRSCFVMTHSSDYKGALRQSVLFHQYGRMYFLSEIRRDGSVGEQVPMSRREKELRRATRGPEMAVVSIAIRAD